MSFREYTPINKLNPTKIKWTIRVRAQAIWRGITRDTQEFRGLNILFFDDCNTRIHAFINVKFAALFEDRLEEGQIYTVSNFTVQKYTGFESHRCVRTQQHIYFAHYTKVEITTNVIPRLPEYSFDLFDLVELEKVDGEKRFLFDVIGVLKDKQDKHEYVNDSQQAKTQLKFSITDGRCVKKVTFFDDLAKQLDKAIQKQSSEPVIIILACAKIGRYQGELNITNYPATRFYLNANHYSVKQLCLRASEPDFYRQEVLAQTQSDDISIITISEIKQLSEVYVKVSFCLSKFMSSVELLQTYDVVVVCCNGSLLYKQWAQIKKVICQVTLKKVEEQFQWFYHECYKCNEELTMIDGRFKCAECKRYIPHPPKRFRVCTICSDESGVIAITLEDNVVRSIIKKTVYDLDVDATQVGDGIKFPPILSALVNKDYSITLEMKKENIENACEVYKAVDIVEGVELLESNIPLSQHSGETEDSSGAIETDATSTLVHDESPNTGKSATKVHVRKMVLPEDSEEDIDVPLTKFKKNSKKSKKGGVPNIESH